MTIFIGQRNVNILIGGGIGGVCIIHFGSARVSISDIQGQLKQPAGLTSKCMYLNI